MRVSKGWLSTVAGMAVLASVADVAAQSVPSSVEPGRVEQQFRGRVMPETEPGSIQTPEAPKAPAVDAKSGSFTLSAIEIEGNSVISSDALKPVYERFIGVSVSMADLQSIAQAVTAHYRNQGYILSQAVVPPQRVKDGVARIRVVEGGVSAVRVEGGEGRGRALVESYLEQIPRDKPLNTKDLERYLLLVEDLPGMTARAVVRPASATGMAEVVVVLTQDAWDAALNADNRGSRYVGPYQLGATFNANSLMGLHERTQLRGVVTSETDEMKYGEITHDQYVGSEGARLRFVASSTATEPGGRIEDLDVEGISAGYGVFATHPFLRSRQSNLFGTLGFEYRNSRLSISDLAEYQDRLRVASLRLAYDYADSGFGVNRIEGGLFKGLDVLDADKQVVGVSRLNGEQEFTKVTLDASRIQPIAGAFSAEVAVAGQWSADPLLASEEFGVGGQFGRGFDPSELTGDHGLAARLELQYNAVTEWAVPQDYQLYGFYDIGKVWNVDVQAGSGEEEHATLASTGLGVRFNAPYEFSGNLEVALPLLREVGSYGQDGDNARVFFGLTKRF